MAGISDALLLCLYGFTGMLLILGGTVVSLQVLRTPSPFPFLTRRQIDPHLWGFHVLGAGFLLSLILMTLRQTPWSQEGLATRLVVMAAVVWMLIALAMSAAALLTKPKTDAPVSLFPPPNARVAMWPSAYRAFIFLGFAALCALGIMVF